MRSRFLLLFPLLGTIAGCSAGFRPGDEVFGTYVLVGVEGNPLPYLESSEAECDRLISEGELTLLPSGTYSLEFSGPHDCTRGGGQIGTLGRVYNGTYTRVERDVAFEADIQGSGTLQFTGTVNPLEAFVTVPPIPPATGPDLTLQFAVVQ